MKIFSLHSYKFEISFSCINNTSSTDTYRKKCMKNYQTHSNMSICMNNNNNKIKPIQQISNRFINPNPNSNSNRNNINNSLTHKEKKQMNNAEYDNFLRDIQDINIFGNL